jgi:hypothetical protein
MSDSILTPLSEQPQETIYSVIRIFRQWMYLPDGSILLAVFGAYAAFLLTGDPVWLLLIGPSSGGKTQILISLLVLAYTHLASTLTEGGLLSGTPRKERSDGAKGGLLREIGRRGVIILKDFTSTLSMPRDTRTAVMAAYARSTTVSGSDTSAWTAVPHSNGKESSQLSQAVPRQSIST